MLSQENEFRKDLNFAFITDRLAVEAMRFLERGTATPSTLFAINSLVQAVILHDQVAIGLVSMMGAELPEYELIRENLGEDISPKIFLPNLVNCSSSLVEDIYYWLVPDFFSAVEAIEDEDPMLSVLLDFLHVGKINDLVVDEDKFIESFGVKRLFGSRSAEIVDQHIFGQLQQSIVSNGRTQISPNDLLSLRDQAGLVAAGLSIGKATGRDVYHALHERPLVANEMQAQGPKKILQLIESELYDGPTIGFEDIDVPPFLGMLISRHSDWFENFWEILFELRDEHNKFRKTYGDFQTAWKSANRGEQRILKRDYDMSWTDLLRKEEYMCEKRISHATLQALISGGKSIAKSAIEVDKFDQSICRVGGLVKLWSNMNSITSQHDARNKIGQKCRYICNDQLWKKVARDVQWAQKKIGDVA